jgi:hypothetical protein
MNPSTATRLRLADDPRGSLPDATVEAALELALERRREEPIVADTAYTVAGDPESYAALHDEYVMDEDGMVQGPSDREVIAHLAAIARRRIAEQGIDPDRHWETIEATVKAAMRDEAAVREIEYLGDGDWDQRADAQRWYRHWEQRDRRSGVELSPAGRSRPTTPMIPVIWRARTGRASHGPRPVRRRRTGAGSRAGPDDGDGDPDPPGVTTPQARRVTAGVAA